MTVAIVRHFENMRTLQRAYDGILNSSPWPFPESLLPDSVESDPQKKQLYSLFKVSQAAETCKCSL